MKTTLDTLKELVEAGEKATPGEYQMRPEQTGPFLFCDESIIAGRFAYLDDGLFFALSANSRNAIKEAVEEIERLREGDNARNRIVNAAVAIVNADTYKHPVLSRADAVEQGVSELHDAVNNYRGFQTGQYGQALKETK